MPDQPRPERRPRPGDDGDAPPALRCAGWLATPRETRNAIEAEQQEGRTDGHPRRSPEVVYEPKLRRGRPSCSRCRTSACRQISATTGGSDEDRPGLRRTDAETDARGNEGSDDAQAEEADQSSELDRAWPWRALTRRVAARTPRTPRTSAGRSRRRSVSRTKAARISTGCRRRGARRGRRRHPRRAGRRRCGSSAGRRARGCGLPWTDGHTPGAPNGSGMVPRSTLDIVAGMEILGVDNVMFAVGDALLARRFYTDVLGLTEAFAFPEAGIVGYQLGNEEPGLVIRLDPDLQPGPPRVSPRLWLEVPGRPRRRGHCCASGAASRSSRRASCVPAMSSRSPTRGATWWGSPTTPSRPRWRGTAGLARTEPCGSC